MKHNSHHCNMKQSSKSMALAATLHCLAGCMVGEMLGVTIGTHAEFAPHTTFLAILYQLYRYCALSYRLLKLSN